jgi:hypothetical protein
MKRFLLVVLVIAVALFVERRISPEATLRYRLTINVDTPFGLKSGDSVMELVKNQKRLFPMPGGHGADWGGHYKVVGELPFVDLGTSGVLFSTRHTLKPYESYDGTTLVLYGLGVLEARDALPIDSDKQVLDLFKEVRLTKNVKPEYYPMFAQFVDMADSQSIQEIKTDALSKTLGPGFAIRNISIEVVDPDEPLTTKLADRFPALAKAYLLGN